MKVSEWLHWRAVFRRIEDAQRRELGRPVVCAADSDYGTIPDFDHVKVVDTVNYAAIFPACRAVVHHGGSGTTAIGLRAGVPTLILWTLADQPYWGFSVKRLGVGTTRRFSATTQQSLVKDLRTILAPQYLTRARQLATRMTKPAESVAAAADLVKISARARMMADRRRRQSDSVQWYLSTELPCP
ncbi:hypothetical protein A5662_02165 [Mycobacteriaceae bacterium 1482268.1]|nr:hypothetical protein A5662_02165 [Mycobacteriaceae bacterium 1482268.1]